MKWFYEKRFYRPDGEVFVKRYTRSFPLNQPVEQNDAIATSNVSEASVSRAKSMVKQIAFANPQLDALLTLTFRDIPTEEVAHQRFDTYRRLVARNYPGWQFLGVKEYQKRGSIHYHLLVNFCPGEGRSPNNPRKKVSTLWKYGFSDYAPIRGDDKWRTELYLLKYLGKDVFKPFSTYYVRSRGLNVILPRYFEREPFHPLAQNIFITRISKKNMVEFNVIEYNYSTTTKQGKYDGFNQLRSKLRHRQE